MKCFWYMRRHTFVFFKVFLTKAKQSQTPQQNQPTKTNTCTFWQGAGPTGKNEEKIQVLTDKIDVLLQQVRFGLLFVCLFFTPCKRDIFLLLY